MIMKKPDLFKFDNLLSMCASKTCWSWLQKCFYTLLPLPNVQSIFTPGRKVIKSHASVFRAFQGLHGTSQGRKTGCSFPHSSRENPPHWLQYFTICYPPSGNSNPFLTMLWFSSLSFLKEQHTKVMEPVSLQSSAWIQQPAGPCSTFDTQVT